MSKRDVVVLGAARSAIGVRRQTRCAAVAAATAAEIVTSEATGRSA